MLDFLWWGMWALIMFVKVEIIGVAGGASRRPYEWNAGYIPFAVMVGIEMLTATIPQ